MAEKKERELLVITRKDGVRVENPLLRVKDKYYPLSSVRTPELRAEADALLTPHAAAVQKLNKYGSHRY